jgi:aryl-alcohol dehydrogenase-like predicted oxidoreductase
MLPVIGLGTARAFDIGPDPDGRAQRAAVLRALLDGGATVIDTSPMYGRAETVIGELLGEIGAVDRPFLATKVWTRGAAKGVAQMEASLGKLRRQRLELMQVHNLLDWRTHLKTLRAWREAGRVRYIGITHYTSGALDDLARVIDNEPLDFVQLAYSLAERDAARHVLPLAAERGVAVLVNRPFGAGAMFRRISGQSPPAWAGDFDCASWGQFFLKYILSHPAVTCAIPATRKAAHMADNLGAARGRLPDATQRRRMERLWASL